MTTVKATKLIVWLMFILSFTQVCGRMYGQTTNVEETFCKVCSSQVDSIINPFLRMIYTSPKKNSVKCKEEKKVISINRDCLFKWARSQVSNKHIIYPVLQQEIILDLWNNINMTKTSITYANDYIEYVTLSFLLVQMLPSKLSHDLLNIRLNLLQNIVKVMEDPKIDGYLMDHFRKEILDPFNIWKVDKKMKTSENISIIDIEKKYSSLMKIDTVLQLRIILTSLDVPLWYDYLELITVSHKQYQNILSFSNRLSNLLPTLRNNIKCLKRYVAIQQVEKGIEEENNDAISLTSYCSIIMNVESEINIIQCEREERIVLSREKARICTKKIKKWRDNDINTHLSFIAH